MIHYALKRRRMIRDENQERQILELARRNGGAVTVAMVAVSTEMNSVEAKRFLDGCHTNGLAQVRVSEGGEVIYHFFGSIAD